MSKPYYNQQKKRWIIEITEKFHLEWQSQARAEEYYEKHKDEV